MFFKSLVKHEKNFVLNKCIKETFNRVRTVVYKISRT